jgi:hypothetical protein
MQEERTARNFTAQRLGTDAHDIRHGNPRKGMVNKLKIEGFLYNWRPSKGQVTGKRRHR